MCSELRRCTEYPHRDDVNFGLRKNLCLVIFISLFPEFSTVTQFNTTRPTLITIFNIYTLWLTIVTGVFVLPIYLALQGHYFPVLLLTAAVHSHCALGWLNIFAGNTNPNHHLTNLPLKHLTLAFNQDHMFLQWEAHVFPWPTPSQLTWLWIWVEWQSYTTITGPQLRST